MAIFISNKISGLAPKLQNRVRSPFEPKNRHFLTVPGILDRLSSPRVWPTCPDYPRATTRRKVVFLRSAPSEDSPYSPPQPARFDEQFVPTRIVRDADP